MDEKKLSELVVGDAGDGEYSWAIGYLDGVPAEIIRLARLGLWAAEHGIPMLKCVAFVTRKVSSREESGATAEGLANTLLDRVESALAKLPEGAG